MLLRHLALYPLLLPIAPSSGLAEGGMHHASMPTEPGQGAFAAIAEIVSLLEADPATDWSRVDIAALQAHLADMDAVVLHSRVAQSEIDRGIAMAVTGDGPVAAAIRRLVTAHAVALSEISGLTGAAAPIEGGAVLRVTTDDDATRERISALGFYGLLAVGAHHQAHHLAIARGLEPHAH